MTAVTVESVATVEPVVAERRDTPDWHDLLVEAVLEPGRLADAYKYFRQYSLCNRWLAATQLRKLGMPLTPINTFKGWLNAGRPVQKGQKASIALIMPVPIRSKKKDEAGDEKNDVVFTKFMLRNYWFHLGQTEGEEYAAPAADDKDWSIAAAMSFLEIEEKSFEFRSVTDLREGYAQGKSIAVSPMSTQPEFVRLREIARIVLGHTADVPAKSVPMEQSLRDVEAEATAYLVAATMAMPGLYESRARLQAVLEEDGKLRIPDRCANRAFAAADKLINAGYC